MPALTLYIDDVVISALHTYASQLGVSASRAASTALAHALTVGGLPEAPTYNRRGRADSASLVLQIIKSAPEPLVWQDVTARAGLSANTVYAKIQSLLALGLIVRGSRPRTDGRFGQVWTYAPAPATASQQVAVNNP